MLHNKSMKPRPRGIQTPKSPPTCPRCGTVLEKHMKKSLTGTGYEDLSCPNPKCHLSHNYRSDSRGQP